MGASRQSSPSCGYCFARFGWSGEVRTSSLDPFGFIDFQRSVGRRSCIGYGIGEGFECCV